MNMNTTMNMVNTMDTMNTNIITMTMSTITTITTMRAKPRNTAYRHLSTTAAKAST